MVIFQKSSAKHYSKSEIDFFEQLTNKINITNFYSGLNENQFFRRFENITYSYDFVYKKKVIEFNGDYWHCNPKYYDKNYYHSHRGMYAFEIWDFDKKKISSIENIGYEVLVIWEDEYKQN